MKNIMKKFYKNPIAVLAVAFTFGIAGLLITTTTSNLAVLAVTSVNLGTADSFAVLAGSTITNNGSSVINGNIGLSPGSVVTGFPSGIINGTQQIANSTAVQAQIGLTTAYGNALGQTPVSTIPVELGGTSKTAGVYDSVPGTFGITGTLTLDAAGDPNAVFIFKSASTLITAGASNVVLINSAQACNVFWQVGSSATLGTNSTFKGNILAFTSATLTTGANVEGRVLARNGAVTLDRSTINRAACAVLPPVSTSSSTSTVTSTSASVIASIVAPTTSPKLPNTGIDPEDKSNTSTWSVIIPTGIFAVLSSFYLVQRKQRK